jgi:hypothetical protein
MLVDEYEVIFVVEMTDNKEGELIVKMGVFANSI